LIIFSVTQADVIVKCRKSRGLSQRELSILAKVATPTLARAELGESEFQATTAVRVLKAMNAQAQFSTEELAEIQSTFGISAGLFLPRSTPQNQVDHTPAQLATALAGLVGSARAAELLRGVLAIEARNYRPENAIKYTGEPEKLADGTSIQITQVVPTSRKKPDRNTGKDRGRKAR
jgi:transcriptional regulator with XRE-family HTH domain